MQIIKESTLSVTQLPPLAATGLAVVRQPVRRRGTRDTVSRDLVVLLLGIVGIVFIGVYHGGGA